MSIALNILFFLVAIIASMLGQGGGILYTPLQLWFGIDFHEAAATSLFLIMVLSLSSSIIFYRAKKIDWHLAFILEGTTVIGGFGGGLFSRYFSGNFLTGLLIIVIITVAIFMIMDFEPKETNFDKSIFKWKRLIEGQLYYVNLFIALPVSLIIGMISGMIGIGGGILKVPLMILVLGVPMDIAVGSSAFMVGLTALGGFTGHVINGSWDWKTSLILAIVVFIGGQIGSRISLGINQRKLKKVFGFFLCFIALTIIFKFYF